MLFEIHGLHRKKVRSAAQRHTPGGLCGIYSEGEATSAFLSTRPFHSTGEGPPPRTPRTGLPIRMDVLMQMCLVVTMMMTTSVSTFAVVGPDELDNGNNGKDQPTE